MADGIEWDVYRSPKLFPVQFGNYAAATHAGTRTILQSAKYSYKGHRTSAYEARLCIRNFLVAPVPNRGTLDERLHFFDQRAQDGNRTDAQRLNDQANVAVIEAFLDYWDDNRFRRFDFQAAEDQNPLMNVGGVEVRLQLDCICLSRNNSGDRLVGAYFLNSHKGTGLGNQEETIRRRNVAGETVALLTFRQLGENYSQHGRLNPSASRHLYIREKHHWQVPTSFARKMTNLDAIGEAIYRQWPDIDPPPNFDASKAVFHD
jgi:hypothetical protein